MGGAHSALPDAMRGGEKGLRPADGVFDRLDRKGVKSPVQEILDRHGLGAAADDERAPAIAGERHQPIDAVDDGFGKGVRGLVVGLIVGAAGFEARGLPP